MFVLLYCSSALIGSSWSIIETERGNGRKWEEESERGRECVCVCVYLCCLVHVFLFVIKYTQQCNCDSWAAAVIDQPQTSSLC